MGKWFCSLPFFFFVLPSWLPLSTLGVCWPVSAFLTIYNIFCFLIKRKEKRVLLSIASPYLILLYMAGKKCENLLGCWEDTTAFWDWFHCSSTLC